MHSTSHTHKSLFNHVLHKDKLNYQVVTLMYLHCIYKSRIDCHAIYMVPYAENVRLMFSIIITPVTINGSSNATKTTLDIDNG